MSARVKEVHEVWQGPAYESSPERRFAEVLSERRPDRLFVFSRKSWALLPPREEETAGGGGLRELGVGGFTYGSYCVGGHRTLACGLRHPTRSDHGELRAGVEAFLAVPR